MPGSGVIIVSTPQGESSGPDGPPRRRSYRLPAWAMLLLALAAIPIAVATLVFFTVVALTLLAVIVPLGLVIYWLKIRPAMRAWRAAASKAPPPPTRSPEHGDRARSTPFDDDWPSSPSSA